MSQMMKERMRLRHCMGCGDWMTVTFYFCPNCLKEYTITGTYCEMTVTGTFDKPEWMRFMINDYMSFHRKKASTHEVPFSSLKDDEYLLIGGVGGIFQRDFLDK
jgi:hypothetical protein